MAMVTATAIETLLPTSPATTLTPNLEKLAKKPCNCQGEEQEEQGRHSQLRRRPDEIIGPFPESVLKEGKIKEDGQPLPEFEDDEEREMYGFLNLEIQSELDKD